MSSRTAGSPPGPYCQASAVAADSDGATRIAVPSPRRWCREVTTGSVPATASTASVARALALRIRSAVVGPVVRVMAASFGSCDASRSK
ncbi:hypothetical protein [Rhodococcus parequi]|uniref:hypothetical protein n=1 Tax=Rhodococcus parequi TaxID=3137122 RepID=UPI003B3AAF49